MSLLIALLLSNFTLTFLVIGVVAAAIDLSGSGRRGLPGEIPEALLRWFLFFVIGCSFFYNFVCHVFFGGMAARFIGWEQSPFQAEVGWASLGYSVLGFMAFRGGRALRIGTVAALSCFLLGAAAGHVIQMISAHDFAPGNAGAIFWADLLIPAFGWALLALTGKGKAEV